MKNLEIFYGNILIKNKSKLCQQKSQVRHAQISQYSPFFPCNTFDSYHKSNFSGILWYIFTLNTCEYFSSIYSNSPPSFLHPTDLDMCLLFLELFWTFGVTNAPNIYSTHQTTKNTPHYSFQKPSNHLQQEDQIQSHLPLVFNELGYEIFLNPP